MGFLYLLAALLGIAVCLQGAVNGVLGVRIGLALALAINSGVVFAGTLAWLAIARISGAAPPDRGGAPWVAYTGGLFGLVILSCAAVAFPRLGASATTVLAVASQLVTALLLDRFGLTGEPTAMTGARVAGLALVGVGVTLVLGVGAPGAR